MGVPVGLGNSVGVAGGPVSVVGAGLGLDVSWVSFGEKKLQACSDTSTQNQINNNLIATLLRGFH